MKVAVIGCGSWGTALGQVLGEKNHDVSIWDIDALHIQSVNKDRENKKYLPGIVLNDNIAFEEKLEATLDNANICLMAVPTQHFRSAYERVCQFISADAIVLNVAKGIEGGSLKRISEIVEDMSPGRRFAVLSGPSHAEEVGRGLITTVVVASKDRKVAELVQETFMTDKFRVYTSDDVVGVELSGALKNIIALGAGISDGIGFGDNAKAALMTRGLVEIRRLGIALGAEDVTFAGLAGVGDLIVTCTSMHSRNRKCGIMIGEGVSPDEAVKRIGMVVEGMFTTEAACKLADRMGVEMPISESIYAVIRGDLEPREAVEMLMGRDRKHEED